MSKVYYCASEILHGGILSAAGSREEFFRKLLSHDPVSYTHLTLPTIYSV